MRETDLGRTIARRRHELGMTQSELGRWLGVSDKAVSTWETGRSLPDATMAASIADVLGMTADELLGRVPAEGNSPDTKSGLLELAENASRKAANDPADSCIQRPRLERFLSCLKALLPLGLAIVVWPLLAQTPMNVPSRLWGTQYPFLFLIALIAISYTAFAVWRIETTKGSSVSRRALAIVVAIVIAFSVSAMSLLVAYIPIRNLNAVVLTAGIFLVWAVATAILYIQAAAK